MIAAVFCRPRVTEAFRGQAESDVESAAARAHVWLEALLGASEAGGWRRSTAATPHIDVVRHAQAVSAIGYVPWAGARVSTGRELRAWAGAGALPDDGPRAGLCWMRHGRSLAVEDADGEGDGGHPAVFEVGRGLFGGRPVYHLRARPRTQPGDGLVADLFATELFPLVAWVGREAGHAVPIDIDADALAAFAIGRAPSQRGRSPYESIRRLDAGEVMRWNAAGRERVLRLAFFSASGARAADEEEARAARLMALARAPFVPPDDLSLRPILERVRHALDGAVSRAIDALPRSSTVAVLAGGGVDSSAVLAAAVAKARGAGAREVAAIALDFDGPGSDRPYLMALARDLGIVPVRVTPASCARFLAGGLVLDAAPYTWPTVGWELAMLTRARELGAVAVLTGAGGDDLFDGDLRLFADAFGAGHAARAVRQALSLELPWAMTPRARIRSLIAAPLLRRAVPPWARAAERHVRTRRAVRALPWAGPRLRAVLSRMDDEGRAPDARVGRTTAARIASLAHASYLLESADMRGRLEATTGCLRLDPLFDDALLRAVATVPPAAFFAGGRLRGLFRLALAGLVPDAVRFRADKAAFEPAFEEVTAAAGGLARFRDLARLDRLGALGIADGTRFSEMWASLEAGGVPASAWLRVWPPLAVEAFVRAHERAFRDAR